MNEQVLIVDDSRVQLEIIRPFVVDTALGVHTAIRLLEKNLD